jgi:hypothetical protein
MNSPNQRRGRGRPPKGKVLRPSAAPAPEQIKSTERSQRQAQASAPSVAAPAAIPPAEDKLQFYERLPFEKGGVYFLIKEGEVVYIGQASNLLGRLASHQVRDYDSVGFIAAPAEILDELERYWIAAFHPEHNRAGKIPLSDFVRPELVQQQRQIWQEVTKEWKDKYREWTGSKAQIIRRDQETNLKFQALLLKKGVEQHRVLEYTKRTFGWVQESNKQKIRYINNKGQEVEREGERIPVRDEASIDQEWEQWAKSDEQISLF